MSPLRKAVNLIFNYSDPYPHKGFRRHTNKPERIHILQMFDFFIQKYQGNYFALLFSFYIFTFLFFIVKTAYDKNPAASGS